MSRDSEHDFASSKYSEHTSTRSFVDDDEKEPEVSPRKNNHLKAIEKIREDHKNLREQDWAIASRASERDALWLNAPPGISTRDIHEMWSDHVRYYASRAWPLDTKPFFHRRARRLVIVFYADRGLFPVRQGLRKQFDRILLDFAYDRLCYKDFQDRDQPVLHYYDEYLRSRNSEKPGYAHWAKKSAEVSRSYLKPGLIKDALIRTIAKCILFSYQNVFRSEHVYESRKFGRKWCIDQMLHRYKDSDIVLVGDDEAEASKLALHGNMPHFMLDDVVSSAEFLCQLGLVLEA